MKKSNLILGTLVFVMTFGLSVSMANTAKETAQMNIVEIAIADEQFSILLYHVVEGSVWSKDIKSGQVKTLNTSASIDVEVAKNKVMVDNSTVVLADVESSNGVIHVIDMVLIPETKTAMNTKGSCSK